MSGFFRIIETPGATFIGLANSEDSYKEGRYLSICTNYKNTGQRQTWHSSELITKRIQFILDALNEYAVHHTFPEEME